MANTRTPFINFFRFPGGGNQNFLPPLKGGRAPNYVILVRFISKGLETITSWVFLKPHNVISELLRPSIIIYKEFKFFLHKKLHKSLILAPNLHAPKIDESCSNCSRKVYADSHVFIF